MADVFAGNKPDSIEKNVQVPPGKTQKTVKPTKKKKTNFKLKRLPKAMVSKWQRMPQTLQDTILTMLEESVSPFTCSGEPAVDQALTKIRVRVERTLSKMKVPKERWNDVESLSSAQNFLTSEKARLDDLEATLQGELRQFEQHESKRGRFESPLEVNQVNSSP